MRSAEQRCPALWKAEMITSRTTCSVSAVESTIIALSPPVSAISMGFAVAPSATSAGVRAASARSIRRATSLEPVKQTPSTRGSAVSLPPTAPSPGSSCSAASGTPASCISATARAAISGVCSAGLASTALPTARAPAICPPKIASGKFHGLMQTMTPCGSSSARSVPDRELRSAPTA